MEIQTEFRRMNQESFMQYGNTNINGNYTKGGGFNIKNNKTPDPRTKQAFNMYNNTFTNAKDRDVTNKVQHATMMSTSNMMMKRAEYSNSFLANSSNKNNN